MIFSITVMSYFDMSDIFLKIVSFAGILTVVGFTVSVLVYLKGLFLPSPGVFLRTGNPIFDFYCGVELYPRIGKYLDLKQLINCRFGMWLWQFVILLSWFGKCFNLILKKKIHPDNSFLFTKIIQLITIFTSIRMNLIQMAQHLIIVLLLTSYYKLFIFSNFSFGR